MKTVSCPRYNHRVCLRSVLAVLLLSAGLLAETASQCPADRPVDDIIAEIHSLQSKKNNRNKNPMPDITCIWGWCRDKAKAPAGEPAPKVEAPPAPDGSSSSRKPVDRCSDTLEDALSAAHNVEVGDYYFEEKNYRAALFRYKDAAEEKPRDPAIFVRMARAFEKLNQVPEAIERYKQALQFTGPDKWHEEAKGALTRLQPQSGS